MFEKIRNLDGDDRPPVTPPGEYITVIEGEMWLVREVLESEESNND